MNPTEISENNPSPAVEIVSRFRIDGKEFDSYEKAITHRENQIEEFLRKNCLNKTQTLPGDAIEIVSFILENRAELSRLLNY